MQWWGLVVDFFLVTSRNGNDGTDDTIFQSLIIPRDHRWSLYYRFALKRAETQRGKVVLFI